MSTAVVTGSSGFIGRALCRRLADEGWTLVTLGGRASGFDIGDRDQVLARSAQLPSEAVFFHLAGRAHEHADTLTDEAAYRRVNVDGTANALALAAQTRASRFVLAGSVAVHGTADGIADETTACAPVTAYARTKWEAEQLVRAGTDVPGVVLRFPMVYGGIDRGNMTRIVSAVRRRRFPPLPTLANRRSVLHVDNAVDALLLAATHPAAVGETFIVTDEVPVSTSEIYRTTLAELARGVPRLTLPLWTLRMLAKVGDGAGWLLRRRMPLDSAALAKLTESAEFSSQKIVRQLGFTPRRTLADGIRSMLDELEQADPR